MSTQNRSAREELHNNHIDNLYGSIRLLETAVVILSLVVFILSGSLIYYRQSTATLSGVALDTITKTQKQITGSSITTHNDSENNFQVTYDKNRWNASDAIIGFVLSGKQGGDVGARISIVVHSSAATFKYDLEKYKKTDGKDDLDTLTDAALANYISKNAKFAKKERTKKWGVNVNHLTVDRKIFGFTDQYFIDFLVANDALYVITYEYPAIPSKSLVDGVLDSVTFTRINGERKVLGAATANTDALTITQSVEVAKPSVVNIWHATCNQVDFHNDGSFRFLKPAYKYCAAFTGSGFIVNNQGYVATNGHVVKLYPEEALVTGITAQYLDEFLIDLFRELYFATNNVIVSPAQAQDAIAKLASDSETMKVLLGISFQMLDKKIINVTETESKYFVKLGNDPFNVDKAKLKSRDFINAVATTSTVYAASLVDLNYRNAFAVGHILRQEPVHGSDVALLKLEGTQKDFPALHIGGSSKLKEGEEMLVVGFPGLVSNNGLVSYESSAQSTITRGVVSALKTDEDGLQLVQTDASIEHGNSGGPALDSQGNVIGIATYGLSSGSGNYNFLRSTQDLLDLMKKNGIQNSEGPLYTSWQVGLKDFWRQHYRDSITVFSLVKEKYPVHPTVSTFIADAQEGIAKGQDKSGFFSNLFDFSNSSTVVVMAAVCSGLFMGILILIVVIILKKKRNSQTQEYQVQVNNTTPPPSVIPTSQPSSPQPQV